ncbi:MAG: nitroreductase family deazaflavin-dependent oxidoreductase [bacterium]
MDNPPPHFERPTAVERFFNVAVGALVRLGIGLPNMRLLEVRGRKSGKRYTLPVDLLSHDGKLYLVAPRGRAAWVRNAEAAGSVVLRRGGTSGEYRLRHLADAEKPPVLKAYLDSFHREVQRFFPVKAGAPIEAFAPLVSRYPAFELTRAG